MCVPYIIGDRLKPGNLKFQVLRKTTFKSVFLKFSIDPNTLIFSAYDLFLLRNNVVNNYCLPDEKQTKNKQKTRPCCCTYKIRWQVTAKHTCTLCIWLGTEWCCKMVQGCMVDAEAQRSRLEMRHLIIVHIK